MRQIVEQFTKQAKNPGGDGAAPVANLFSNTVVEIDGGDIGKGPGTSLPDMGLSNVLNMVFG